ncbi:glycosyltransferase family 1 protein [Hymenobacter aquaticus]|uniref:Glycosyltransferase family 1 protein n=1 Tax=Hymenobacter aquaticus TaxID=1867101 RepID=A0A4Z0Q4V4_9BACT|nr:glycosyltransferase family 4 protein [Hymenobacter aquaticus]TGE25090.1 glycosyltransferase family 1 protein [Hymenobacter aquaticus]
MNILLVSFMQPDAPSGVRVHYLQLADLLRQQGHRVDVVTPASLGGWRRYAVAAVRHGFYRLGATGRALAMEADNFLRVLWSIDAHQPYDLVHAHDAGSGVAARRALGGRVPVVVTGHFNDHPGEELVLQYGLTGRPAAQVLRWHTYLLAQTRYFLGVSEYVRRRTALWLAPQALHTVIHNGIDLTAFAQAPADAALLRLARGRQVLLNIGHLEPRKNQRFLLRVARALRTLRQDFLIALAGYGPDEALLRQQIAANHLEDVVLLLGQCEQVAPVLRASTLYVHVATRENCPLVLLEAMACRVPALAFAVGGVPEVLAATPEALLPPDATAEAVAERLHALLSSAPDQEALRQRQAAAVAAHFDVRRMTQATLGFYHEALRHFQAASSRAATSRPLAFPVPDQSKSLTT